VPKLREMLSLTDTIVKSMRSTASARLPSQGKGAFKILGHR
jgi:hypothetical protein